MAIPDVEVDQRRERLPMNGHRARRCQHDQGIERFPYGPWHKTLLWHRSGALVAALSQLGATDLPWFGDCGPARPLQPNHQVLSNSFLPGLRTEKRYYKAETVVTPQMGYIARENEGITV
jgi:hypothetical protein